MGVRDRAELQLDHVQLAISLEFSVVELSSIIGDDSLRDPEPGDDILPCEVLDLLLGNGG